MSDYGRLPTYIRLYTQTHFTTIDKCSKKYGNDELGTGDSY